jgi:hypothetical protein
VALTTQEFAIYIEQSTGFDSARRYEADGIGVSSIRISVLRSHCPRVNRDGTHFAGKVFHSASDKDQIRHLLNRDCR